MFLCVESTEKVGKERMLEAKWEITKKNRIERERVREGEMKRLN